MFRSTPTKPAATLVTLDDQPLKLGSNAKKFWQISHDWAPKTVVTNFDGRDLSDGVMSVVPYLAAGLKIPATDSGSFRAFVGKLATEPVHQLVHQVFETPLLR